MKKNYSVTIGIPTYEAGNSLVATLNSIYAQSAINSVEKIIIAVDGNSMSKEIQEKIKHPKLEVKIFTPRAGQSARINDLCKLCTSDLFILTNDDVILEKNMLEKIISAYENTHADLLSCDVAPLPARTFFETIVSMGYKIGKEIYLSWNNADNYLTCNGRLFGLSHALYSTLSVPHTIWNNDAYIYLFTKTNGLKHVHVVNARVFYRSPSTLGEHLKQSTKFQRSFVENQTKFKEDISKYYSIPKNIIYQAVWRVFVKQPLITFCYFFLISLSRLLPKKKDNNQKGYWTTDTSTKKLHGTI